MTSPTPEPSSRLWASALDFRDERDGPRQARDALRVSVGQVRANAGSLASRIAADLPEFTVHDERHLDALWPLADRISPEDLELTPTEAWTLGVAILLHDLGLAVAAYPGGRAELRETPEWPDAHVAALRAEQVRSGDSAETLDPDELDLRADATVLRKRHAARAGELAQVRWDDQFLIADPSLREALGTTAGRIAASHWQSVEELSALGSRLGAPAGMPGDWTIRPILLAVLLRLADAAHLDAGRAPPFERALRRLGEEARRHWDFQGRMLQPVLNGERLQFNSSKPFPPDQAGAWWLCYDHLRLLDDELAGADSLLQAHDLPRLAARSVQGARDPAELARTIEPAGWEPVDARIDVSNVTSLVERLGGRALYGSDEMVPLRELLQNASDAVMVRRAQQPGFEGCVEVEVSADLRELSVRDDGVGMDVRILTGALLDFGRSLWESEELATVHPGLQAAGFQPTGKFGIGFFSVFMWADEVKVVSRARHLGEDGTRVLVFPEGLRGRPLLRYAEAEERLMEPGTLVRLRIREGEKDLRRLFDVETKFGGLIPEREPSVERLISELRWLAPAFEVDLRASLGEGELETVLAGGDWRSIPPEELLARIRKEGANEATSIAMARTTLLGPPDKPSGRIAFAEHALERNCALVAGGLRVGVVGGLAGLLSVDQVNASRRGGHVVASPDEIAAWATAQADADADPSEDCLALAARVLSLGGDPGPTPLAECAEGLLTRAKAMEWLRERQRVVLVDVYMEFRGVEEQADLERDAYPDEWKDVDEDEDAWPRFSADTSYELVADVLHISGDGFRGYDESSLFGWGPSGFQGSSSISVEDEILHLAAVAWGCEVDEIVVEDFDEREDLIVVGEYGPMTVGAVELIQPKPG